MCRTVQVCFVSVVTAKLYNYKSLMPVVSGYAVSFTTSLEFLPYLCMDKRRVICITVLVLTHIVILK